MENASKALIMAGSVLIAIIIIALLYSFISTLSANAEAEDLKTLAEQTEAFNKEYEAFEKKLLRGTDLITVINKAIANNKKYDDQDNIYDVDVKFTLKTAVSKITVSYVKGKQKTTKEVTEFEPGTVYNLIDNSQKDRINKKLYDFMSFGTQTTTDSYMLVNYDGEGDQDYEKIYDNFTVFKRKLFRCKKIDYSGETGRVNLLEFEEILPAGGELEGYN